MMAKEAYLIVGHGVKGEEGVHKQVERGLVAEYVFDPRGLLFDNVRGNPMKLLVFVLGYFRPPKKWLPFIIQSLLFSQAKCLANETSEFCACS